MNNTSRVPSFIETVIASGAWQSRDGNGVSSGNEIATFGALLAMTNRVRVRNNTVSYDHDAELASIFTVPVRRIRPHF